MRIFSAGISTETNSFSPLPVGLATFEKSGIIRANHATAPRSAKTAVSHALYAHVARDRLKIVDGLLADAPPGGLVSQAAYETLRDELLDGLRRALPVDGVLLALHGGMIAHGYDDPEGDLLARVRALAGPDAVIGAELDPHCHLSQAMLDNATLLVCYKENPHTDVEARAADLVRLAIEAMEGRTRPVMSAFDCRMADVFQTQREPMKSFVDRLRAMEGRDGVLDISVVHGFRRGDVPIMGAKMLVITDERAQQGAALAERLGRELFEMRGRSVAPYVGIDAAIDQALSMAGRPVVLADMADNPGGGSPGDSTYVIRALLDRGLRDFAAGALCDPMAVALAHEAGEGARLSMRIGGKACALSGAPLDLDVTVTRIVRAAVAKVGPYDVPMGDAAAVTFDGAAFVLCSDRIQTFGPGFFEALGVDWAAKKIVVVKSGQHYRAYFGPRASGDIVVDAPGVCVADVAQLPFKRIKRPMWPFDPDPFAR